MGAWEGRNGKLHATRSVLRSTLGSNLLIRLQLKRK